MMSEFETDPSSKRYQKPLAEMSALELEQKRQEDFLRMAAEEEARIRAEDEERARREMEEEVAIKQGRMTLSVDQFADTEADQRDLRLKQEEAKAEYDRLQKIRFDEHMRRRQVIAAEDILAEVGALSIADHPHLDIANRQKSYFQWNIAFNQIQVKERLGGGDMGDCIRGFWKEKQVVLKKLKNPLDSEAEMDALRDEVALMVTFDHPNIAKFYGLTMQDQLSTVTEYVPGAVLFNYLRNPSFRDDVGATRLVLKWCRQIADALHYMHVRGLIYRGLKPRNICFDREMNMKLRDYGLTAIKNDMRRRKIVSLGDIPYSAPELLLNRVFDNKVDVYAYAILMNEMFAIEPPFKGVDPRQVVAAVVREQARPDIDVQTPLVFQKLIVSMWAADPTLRPSFEKITKILAQPDEKLYGFQPKY